MCLIVGEGGIGFLARGPDTTRRSDAPDNPGDRATGVGLWASRELLLTRTISASFEPVALAEVSGVGYSVKVSRASKGGVEGRCVEGEGLILVVDLDIGRGMSAGDRGEVEVMKEMASLRGPFEGVAGGSVPSS